MATSPIVPTYPFDPTGTAVSNRVTNEQHPLTASNYRDYQLIIPRYAPFYETGLVLRYRDLSGNIRPLTFGIDYYLGHQFQSASRSVGKSLYGSIYILDKTLTGIIIIDNYQTIGGMWNIDENKIAEILADRTHNPLITTWEQVNDLPVYFPPIDHPWNIYDMVGMSDVKEALDSIQDAIRASGEGSIDDHINNHNNPHNVTKAQVGLGNVNNYNIATDAQTVTGTATNLYVVPSGVRAAITQLAITPLTTHTNNLSNPHNVTKGQVGLGNVNNFATATITETTIGSSSSLYTTPAGVRGAIDELVAIPLADHINDQSNPHQVNKAQVGLGNVNNYGTANNSQTIDGVATDLYVTPAGLKAALVAAGTGGGGGEISDHVADMNNPHQVTKTQVGLGNVDNYSTATVQETVLGAANNLFVTPEGASALIENLVGTSLTNHVSAINNPHQVTKGQVGLGNVSNFGTASVAETLEGTSENLFTTPLGVFTLVKNLAEDPLNAHVANTNNPHSVTKTQVGLGSVNNYGTATPAEASTGTANNLYVTPEGLTSAINTRAVTPLNNHLSDTNNPHSVTAAQIGAYDQGQVNTLLQSKLNTTATAADSSKLEGKTLAEIFTDVAAMTVDNSNKLEGKTLTEIKAEIGSGEADDTTRFDGYTVTEYADYIIKQNKTPVYDTILAPVGNASTPVEYYIPLDVGFIDPVSSTNVRAALYRFDLFSTKAEEKLVTSYYIYQKGSVIRWYGNNGSDIVKGVYYAFSSDAEIIDETTFNKVYLYLHLEYTGLADRSIRVTRLAGENSGKIDRDTYPIVPTLPSGAFAASEDPDIIQSFIGPQGVAGEDGEQGVPGVGVERELVTGTLNPSDFIEITEFDWDSVIQAMVSTVADPDDYFDAISKLTIIRRSTNITVTNVSTETLNYRITGIK
ncbi:MAG: hypothetical protein M0R77_00635 [Gammaproteobacteria bacterium]|nr:hypothetical protein [Acholeplasmataceae bacterium]MCK9529060.1 hypothetical protein [Gammaproteobacteria bacterium]